MGDVKVEVVALNEEPDPQPDGPWFEYNVVPVPPTGFTRDALEALLDGQGVSGYRLHSELFGYVVFEREVLQ